MLKTVPKPTILPDNTYIVGTRNNPIPSAWQWIKQLWPNRHPRDPKIRNAISVYLRAIQSDKPIDRLVSNSIIATLHAKRSKSTATIIQSPVHLIDAGLRFGISIDAHIKSNGSNGLMTVQTVSPKQLNMSVVNAEIGAGVMALCDSGTIVDECFTICLFQDDDRMKCDVVKINPDEALYTWITALQDGPYITKALN